MKKILVVLLALSVSINITAKPKREKKPSWFREAFINGNKKDVRGNIVVTAIAIGFGVFLVRGSIPLNNINNKLENKFGR
jgi:hypothetical protein